MYRHYLHDVFSFHIKRCLYNVHSNSCWWSGPKSIPRPNHCKKKKNSNVFTTKLIGFT